ncbi:hypothetical protein BDP27DRAFT_1322623 [Rhodocollybia butyracea]|uniref:DUF7587 domain-containing protein n=1 Tax=Rhodocollybia butyracea TaxID=206335 RepID=A0A9P5PWJ0_9AGAR|nr:hypothetical protein BDP27DRAFT_1322623 [Rhodocollybia butyracea]
MSPLQLFRAYTPDSGAVFNERSGFLARGSGICFDPNNSPNKAKEIVERHLNWNNTSTPSPLISTSTQSKAKRIAASLRRKHPRSIVYIAQVVYKAEELSTRGPEVHNMCALAKKLGADNAWKDKQEYVFVNHWIPLPCIVEVSQVVEWTTKLVPSKYISIWPNPTATSSELFSADIRLLSMMMMTTVFLQRPLTPAAPPVSVSATLSLFRAFTRTANTDSTLDRQNSFVAGNTAMKFNPVGKAGAEAASILKNHLNWDRTRVHSPLISVSLTFDDAKEVAANLRKLYPGDKVYIAEVVFDQKKAKPENLGVPLEQSHEGYVFVKSIPRKFVLNVRQVATWKSKGKPSTYKDIWKNSRSPYYQTTV